MNEAKCNNCDWAGWIEDGEDTCPECGGTLVDIVNGYIATYRDKRLEIHAKSMGEAIDIAKKEFKAKKPWEINVGLAEKDGKPVIHLPLM